MKYTSGQHHQIVCDLYPYMHVYPLTREVNAREYMTIMAEETNHKTHHVCFG